MRKCELCESPARMYCESDQASLCWDCDAKVHGANFLVAKHSRTLLCHACQNPTPWTGSGSRLAPTMSLCDGCASDSTSGRNGDEGGDRDRDDEDEDSNDGGSGDSEEEQNGDDDDGDDDDDDDDGGGGDGEDGENQVVPWSSTTENTAAPLIGCCSNVRIFWVS